MGITCHLQMERWDGTVLNISSTAENLGIDTTSYPIGKRKVSMLKAMTVVPGDLSILLFSEKLMYLKLSLFILQVSLLACPMANVVSVCSRALEEC